MEQTGNRILLYRQAAGPIAIAISVWCAAGTITIAAPDRAVDRLALPAPWWVLPIAMGVAALVPSWRRRPLTTTPALLSTLPWWPVPLPAIALVWTGPLAWLPIGLAVWSARGDLRLPPRAALNNPWVAGLVTLVAASATAFAVRTQVPGGDEPHYLVIAQSLLRDHDLAIQDNYQRGDYREYYGGALHADVVVRGRGEAYSIHAPGTAILVAPAFAAGGYLGAKILMLLLAAVAGGLIWQTALLTSRDAGAAWFAWAAVAGSATFLLHSGMIFPDLPGALAVVAAVWLIVRLEVSTSAVRSVNLVAVSAALAALPWLHTRFAILAAGLGLVIVWRLFRAPGPDAGRRWRKVALFLAVPIASALLWFGFFYSVYGTLSPLAPYGTDPRDRSWRFVPGGLLAILFDGQYGLLAYSPILAVAVLGATARVRSLVLIAFAYLAVVAIYWMWWGGLPATPARFATAMLPLVVAPVAISWTKSDRSSRELWLLWLLLSLGITAVVVSVGHGDLAWNYRDAQPRWLEWLGPIVNLARAWPSFFWRLSVPTAFQPDLASEWPFALHAVGAVITVAAVTFAAIAIARRAPARSPVVAAWSVAIAMMIAVQLGWWLSGSTGLDAARSQITWLRGAASGRTALAIGPAHVGPATADLSAGLRVRAEEAGLYGKVPWGVFAGLPPGRYEFRFFMQRPAAGVARVRLGRAAPFATLALAALSQQAMVVEVPADGVLVVESDEDVRSGVGGVLELRRVTAN